jgi:hypothetical protein
LFVALSLKWFLFLDLPRPVFVDDWLYGHGLDITLFEQSKEAAYRESFYDYMVPLGAFLSNGIGVWR